jgi:ribulose-bisphosphate carboxylase large chain
VRIYAHRANLTGPGSGENSPDAIAAALRADLGVEIDVWASGGDISIGHDAGAARVDADLLRHPHVICHAKNVEALSALAEIDAVFFALDRDGYALCSDGRIWANYGTAPLASSIMCSPELVGADEDLEAFLARVNGCHGVCTDYPLRCRELVRATRKGHGAAALDPGDDGGREGIVAARYHVESSDIPRAADALAIGQSLGNPDIRAARETESLVAKHAAKVVHIAGSEVTVHFPAHNFAGDSGVSHLLSVLLGGQFDIDLVRSCRLVDIDVAALGQMFRGPRFGVHGIRELVGVHDRPLVGGIVKPKIGLSPAQLADVCREMALGGVDFIKEDEVLGNPPSCPLEERVAAVAEALDGFATLYAPCVTADAGDVVRHARLARDLGATAVHLNIWSGFGAYRHVREQVSVPLFFQKSGDKLWTSGRYGIDSVVLCKLVRLLGCDFMHIGMSGGYLHENPAVLTNRLGALQGDWCEMPRVLPSFSCGAHPGLAYSLAERFGPDIMITAGGAIHGHPMGATAGARAFRQALEGWAGGTEPAELSAAIALWGTV